MIGRLNKKVILVFAAGFFAAVVVFLAYNALNKKVTTSKFCGTACHEMVGVYHGWQNSGHYINNSGTVTECVDCHLPPQQDHIARMGVEAREGIKNTFKHMAGGYDANEMQKKVLASMPDSRCGRCHANLMAKPKSIASRIAHGSSAWINKGDPNAQRCVDCHNVMHQRKIEK